MTKGNQMKLASYIILMSTAMTSQAMSQSIIDELCGTGHVSETAIVGPVSKNPDGYYLSGLKTQLSHGDQRIIHAVGSEYHVCTRPVSTPEFGMTQMYQSANKREVTYLFVPTASSELSPNS